MTYPNNPASGGEPPAYEPAASAPPPPPAPPPAAPPPPPAAPPVPTPAPTPSPPASAASQAWNDAQANLQSFDPKSVNPQDWAIVGLGVLIFLLSFGSFYKYTFTAGGLTQELGTANAYHGFFGWFGAWAALVGAAVLAVHLIARLALPFNVRFVLMILFGVAAVAMVLALVSVPGPSFIGFGGRLDTGHGFAYWLSLLATLGGAALAYLRWQASGGRTNLA